MAELHHILGHRFRANPAFDLIALDQLPERYRPSVLDGAMRPAPGVALVPRSGNGITVKILNGRAADLVRGLKVVGHLPSEVETEGAAANQAVARLVLDGALEIEDGDRLVSGPRAHGTVCNGSPRVPASGRLAALSLRGIRYGQALMISDVQLLSRRLYSFGTIPRRFGWDLLMDTADDVIGPLGLSRGGFARRILAADYQPSTHPHWLSWSRELADSQQRPNLPYKLYVSPRPEALVACFPAVVTVLAEKGVWSFKIGRGTLGLLRPDKLVAYFEDVDHLHQVSNALARALQGCPSQGVPFTAQASTDGLLSWGMDPPPAERLLDSQPPESWRYWVTNRLASGMVHAQSAIDSVEPCEFALDRLTLEGVDPLTWLPADTIWRNSELS